MPTFTAFRGQATLQDQINRLFNDAFERSSSNQDSNLTAWAPAVDIHENEHELVVKADLPGIDAEGSRHSRREQYPDHPRRTQV